MKLGGDEFVFGVLTDKSVPDLVADFSFAQ